MFFALAMATKMVAAWSTVGNNFFCLLVRDRSLFIWGEGGWGEKSWGGPGLFFLEKRGGPKENFTMIGGGSLCVL